ncbi:MAG: DNA translocase FtsK [Muribaculaceae bacterium]|nr:DNA translocase FtsK [Muribaculaceae bacterium]
MHIGSGLLALAVTIFLIGMLAVMYLAQLISFYRNVSGSVRRAREAMIQAAGKARSTSTELADVPDHEPQETPAAPRTVESKSATPVSPVRAEQSAPAAPVVGFSIDDIEDSVEPDRVASTEEPAEEKVSIFDEFPIEDAPERPTQSHSAVSENESPMQAAPAAGNAAQSTVSEPEFVIHDPGEGTDIPQIKSEALEETPEDKMQPYDIRDELSRYKFPTADLLIDRPMSLAADSEEQEENKNMIVNTLSSFGIGIAKISATIGPTITLYEIVPADGVRISQIRSLEDDIALQLAALGIRIIAPIPGKGTIGIEVPNRDPQTVSMFSVITSKEFRDCKMLLPMALGSTINNRIFVADLAKMPHLLVAGATGQGKSVGLNCIIASLLYKKHPGELKFVLIDPKMVEFSLYSRLEHHFLAKLPDDDDDAIVTDANKALNTLASLCVEMDNRYDLLKDACVRTVEEYNRKFAERRLNPEKGHKYMPYIVIIVDEFADLIMTAGKDITLYIARIAQKARAVGMHMIIATQRPSTDIITGMIKANFPGRIAFRVAQMVDSKTILDRPGANRLIGRGDMLFSHNSMMERVQCAFIDTPEVEGLVDFINKQVGYPSAYLLPEPPVEGASGAIAPGSVDLSKRDELFDDCARFVSQNPTASTSLLQRRFGIGYAKAGKIMDQLEAAGIVGPALGQKPRAVLIDSFGIEDVLRAL